MAFTDPNPKVLSADRGGINVIASAVTSTTGYALSGTTLPVNPIVYGRAHGQGGVVNPNAFFQVDISTGTASGQFIGSNDGLNWYQIGTWDQAGAYPLGLAAGYRYVSASIDAIAGGASVSISVCL